MSDREGVAESLKNWIAFGRLSELLERDVPNRNTDDFLEVLIAQMWNGDIDFVAREFEPDNCFAFRLAERHFDPIIRAKNPLAVAKIERHPRQIFDDLFFNNLFPPGLQERFEKGCLENPLRVRMVTTEWFDDIRKPLAAMPVNSYPRVAVEQVFKLIEIRTIVAEVLLERLKLPVPPELRVKRTEPASTDQPAMSEETPDTGAKGPGRPRLPIRTFIEERFAELALSREIQPSITRQVRVLLETAKRHGFSEEEWPKTPTVRRWIHEQYYAAKDKCDI